MRRSSKLQPRFVETNSLPHRLRHPACRRLTRSSGPRHDTGHVSSPHQTAPTAAVGQPCRAVSGRSTPLADHPCPGFAMGRRDSGDSLVRLLPARGLHAGPDCAVDGLFVQSRDSASGSSVAYPQTHDDRSHPLWIGAAAAGAAPDRCPAAGRSPTPSASRSHVSASTTWRRTAWRSWPCSNMAWHCSPWSPG